MKLSRTAIKELSKRYRAVLLKCALMNLAVFTIGFSSAHAEDLMVKNDDNITVSVDHKAYDNIAVSGGNLTLEEDIDISATAVGTAITISGGNVTLNKYSDITATKGNVVIGGGSVTLKEGSEINADEGNVTINGGNITFEEDNEINAKIGTVTISGGEFINPDIEAKDIIVNGGKISFANESELVASNNLTIDSDAIDFSMTEENEHMSDQYSFSAGNTIEIKGNGLSVIQAEMLAPTIKGNITASNRSRIGNFGWVLDKWKYGDKAVYSVWDDDTTSADFTLESSNLVLNDDSFAGAGLYYTNITSSQSPIAFTLEKAVKITETEMNDSIAVILDKIANASEFEDLDVSITDALEVDYIGDDDLEDYVEDNWESRTTDTFKGTVTTYLKNAYEDYNTTLDGYSKNVTVEDSKVTLNGTSALVNYSFKDDDKGNITVTNSEIIANGQNKIYASEGDVAFGSNSKLTVNSSAVLDIISKDNNKASFDSTSSINLAGTLNGNVNATGTQVNFNSSSALLNGDLTGSANLKFNDSYDFAKIRVSNATLKNIEIADGKTLNVGEGSLKAETISGGTISAILTDAAKETAIITAEATNVTLNLDMENASRDIVNQYKITAGEGYTFGDYATNRYAISATAFAVEDAKTIGKLTDWTGGNLYILRLATESQAAVEDIEKAGISVSDTEKNAAKALDLDDDIMAQQSSSVQANVKMVNDELARAEGNPSRQKQILTEVAPDQSASGAKTASNTANAVNNVVSTRFRGGMKPGRMSAGHGGNGHHGRQGGDYVAGQLTVWAQGMMNYAKLDTTDGYNSHSNGFAMGFEGNINDEVKVGAGYAFTRTDISSQRSNTDVDTHTGFIYGEYKPNEFYVNAVVSYGHSKYDEKTSSLGLTSDYEADTISAQVAAGYELGLVTPEIGLRYTNVKLKEYEDAVGQKMHDDRQETWTGVASVKVEKEFMLGDKTALTPEVKVGATYDFVRDDECRGVSLADHSSYVTEGDPMKRFGIEAGVGVTLSISDDVEVSVNYEGKYKTHYEDHTGMINFKYNF